MNQGDLPHMPVGYPSTTLAANDVKIAPARRATASEWREAPPLRLAAHFGPETPVTLTITPHVSGELWLEISDFRGRFWIHHDVSVWELVTRMQAGGYWMRDRGLSTTSGRKGGTARGRRRRGTA